MSRRLPVVVLLAATLACALAAARPFPRTVPRYSYLNDVKVDGSNVAVPRSVRELTEADERRGRMEAMRHHSLHPPFLDLGDKLRHWEYGQDTVVTDDYIRLTPDETGRHGFLTNTYRNELHAWEAIFGLYVFSRKNIGADGVAFWYRPMVSSEVGGVMLGASADFVGGVGVLFDTYDNDARRDNPRVQLVYRPASGPLSKRVFSHENDFFPELDSTSTDVNSIDDYGCTFNFRNVHEVDLIIAKLRYDAVNKTLTLKLKHARAVDDTTCALLRNVELPVGNQFGFTAQTGGVSDTHDIAFLHVTPLSTLDEDARAEHELKELELQDRPHADGFDHRDEKKDRSYWRDKSSQNQENADQLERQYDTHELDVKKREAKDRREKRKQEIVANKNRKEREAVHKVITENNPYRRDAPAATQSATKIGATAATNSDAAVPSTLPAREHVPPTPRLTLEEMLQAHKRMVADGTNPNKLPPYVPPPTDMKPNEELEEYRRTKGASAHHHHHGGHKPEEVPENERRFWRNELPPAGPDGKPQRWPETVPTPANQPAAQAEPPTHVGHPREQAPDAPMSDAEADRLAAEVEARAAAEAHAQEVQQRLAEEEAHAAVEAAARDAAGDGAAVPEAAEEHAADDQQGDGDAPVPPAPPAADAAGDAQTNEQVPFRRGEKVVVPHHDPPVETDPVRLQPKEEHIQREIKHDTDFAALQEMRRARRDARFKSKEGETIKQFRHDDPKRFEKGPQHAPRRHGR